MILLPSLLNETTQASRTSALSTNRASLQTTCIGVNQKDSIMLQKLDLDQGFLMERQPMAQTFPVMDLAQRTRQRL